MCCVRVCVQLNLVVVPAAFDVGHPNLWDGTINACEGIILLFDLSQVVDLM